MLLSALLLMAVFRSILVPVKAVVMNLLSIGAAFGLIVAVFQWGWGASLIGIDGTGPIISFFPIFLFAIIFGLSMDYEVFLMSRMHEEWENSHDATASVTRGLALTGRVITAAAAIMCTVFLSFMIGEDRIIKLFGLGLASAVFIDAVIIRSVLVPAVMQLFGERAWWLPGWLDRILPRLHVEPAEGDPAPTGEHPVVEQGQRPALAGDADEAAGAQSQAGEDLPDLPKSPRGRRPAHVDERVEPAAVPAEGHRRGPEPLPGGNPFAARHRPGAQAEIGGGGARRGRRRGAAGPGAHRGVRRVLLNGDERVPRAHPRDRRNRFAAAVAAAPDRHRRGPEAEDLARRQQLRHESRPGPPPTVGDRDRVPVALAGVDPARRRAAGTRAQRRRDQAGGDQCDQ